MELAAAFLADSRRAYDFACKVEETLDRKAALLLTASLPLFVAVTTYLYANLGDLAAVPAFLLVAFAVCLLGAIYALSRVLAPRTVASDTLGPDAEAHRLPAPQSGNRTEQEAQEKPAIDACDRALNRYLGEPYSRQDHTIHLWARTVGATGHLAGVNRQKVRWLKAGIANLTFGIPAAAFLSLIVATIASWWFPEGCPNGFVMLFGKVPTGSRCPQGGEVVWNWWGWPPCSAGIWALGGLIAGALITACSTSRTALALFRCHRAPRDPAGESERSTNAASLPSPLNAPAAPAPRRGAACRGWCRRG